MNERDSETIAGMLEDIGYERAGSRRKSPRASGAEGADRDAALEAADVIVINTCSVRENADNKFFGLLGQFKRLKENDPGKVIAVCGCMTQQSRIVDRIRSKFPWVDIVFGTMNIESFPALLEEALEKKRRLPPHRLPFRSGTLVEIKTERNGVCERLPSRRKHPYKAFVNIMYGCDNFCTYCIVPYTRGRERSRGPEAVIGEAQALAGDGVKEITLLGQNVNSYRGGGTSFPELIRMMDGVAGLERIRFMTSHPKDLSDELIDCYRSARRLCPSIHLPVQSGSSNVLRRMNRGYTKEEYLALIDKLRDARPDVVITTDFIVGFPGETDSDFEDTMDLIDRARFDAAFTFLYSPREGTPAAKYDDQIPADAAQARFVRMVDLLNSISTEKNKRMIGESYDVLVEGPSKTDAAMLSGRTPGGKLVNIRANARGAEDAPTEKDPAGRILPVRITEAGAFSFIGEFE